MAAVTLRDAGFSRVGIVDVDAHHGKLQAAAPPFGGLAIRIELPRHSDVVSAPAAVDAADRLPVAG